MSGGKWAEESEIGSRASNSLSAKREKNKRRKKYFTPPFLSSLSYSWQLRPGRKKEKEFFLSYTTMMVSAENPFLFVKIKI